MRRLGLVAVIFFLAFVPAPASSADVERDLEAARALFEKNLASIKARDREGYLSCYWNDPSLARTGPAGMSRGFDSFADQVGEGWPDVFEGRDLQLVSIRPGVVYGTYRYRVVYDANEVSGISERLFVETEEGWRIAVTTAFASADTPPPPRALVGATLLDGTGRSVPDAVVTVRNGKIECAGTRSSCDVPSGMEVTDLSGYWITPGLIDAHVHFAQSAWADGRPDSMDVRKTHPYHDVQKHLRENADDFGRAFLCSGVTSVFDVGGYAWTIELADDVESVTTMPRVTASGPLLSTLDHWLNLPGERQFIHIDDVESAQSGADYLISRGSGAVKVWFIVRAGDDVSQLETVVASAAQRARTAEIPLIVHATGLAEAKAAIRAGAHLLVHSVWDKPIDDEFIALAKKSGVIYNPTLTVIDGYERMYEAAVEGTTPAIDDPNRCTSPRTRDLIERTAEFGKAFSLEQRLAGSRGANVLRREMGAKNLARVVAAGIPVAMGTDAGNPLTVHGPSVYAEMEAMQAAGMTPMQVLVASTHGSALAMNRADDLGTLEAGKWADLLVVGADPARDIAAMRRVRHVMRGGVLRAVKEMSRKSER